jgi:hypothetical protein
LIIRPSLMETTDLKDSADRKPRGTGRVQALILTSVLVVFWVAAGSLVFPHARSTDFLSFYTGASFALHGDWAHIYTAAAQLAREQQLTPDRTEIWPFIRPPVYAMLISPLALIPFRAASVCWICAQSALLLGCWAWGWRRFGPEAVCWGALYFTGPIGIAHGQDCAVYLAILCGAFALGEKKRYFLCGLLLGLGLVKFPMFLLWPLVLLVQRRWSLLAGLTVSGLVQGLISLAVLGWSGVSGYVNFILHLNSYPVPEKYLDVNAIFFNLGWTPGWVLWLAPALIACIVLGSARRAGPLWITFTLASAGSLLISPHAYGYDGTMLLLPIWCVIFLSGFRVARIIAATICTPITLLASFADPPFSCFLAVAMVGFLIAVCVESAGRVYGGDDGVVRGVQVQD